MPIACAVCGRTPGPDEPAAAPPDAAPLTWSRQTGRDARVEFLCTECTRAGVRGIEARLDPEWW